MQNTVLSYQELLNSKKSYEELIDDTPLRTDFPEFIEGVKLKLDEINKALTCLES